VSRRNRKLQRRGNKRVGSFLCCAPVAEPSGTNQTDDSRSLFFVAPAKRYGIHTCPTVRYPWTQATRALALPPPATNIGSASSRIDKFKLICDFSKRPIQSSKSICFHSLPRAPYTQGCCVHVNHQPVRPEHAVISLLFRSLLRRRTRIPAVNERPSLIISCKNSKNSEGPFERTGHETCMHPVARKRGPALQAPVHRSGCPLSAGMAVTVDGCQMLEAYH
jgi:hypothetical protein